MVCQFSGRSKSTSTLHKTYCSVIRQLKWAFKLNSDEQLEQEASVHSSANSVFELKKMLTSLDLNELKDYLLDLLAHLNRTYPSRQIFVCIDAVEQLATAEDSALDWLIYSCPANTKIVYSVLGSCEDVLERMRNHITDKSCFLEMKRWSSYTSLQVLNEDLLVRDFQSVFSGNTCFLVTI